MDEEKKIGGVCERKYFEVLQKLISYFRMRLSHFVSHFQSLNCILLSGELRDAISAICTLSLLLTVCFPVGFVPTES